MLGQAIGLAHRTMAVHGETVVLAEKQHRHLHERGEIQALVVDALFRRAVAEHRHGDARGCRAA